MLFAVLIWGLFALDRDRNARTSKALWLPVIWLWINSSRPISQWLQMTPPQDLPNQYLEGSPLDRIIFTILVTAGLMVVLNRGRQAGTVLRANWPIVLLFYYCLLSVFWSDYPLVALKRSTKAIGDLIMLLIVLTDCEPRSAVKRLLTRCGFLLIPLSVLLIEYYPGLGQGLGDGIEAPTYTGVTTNKNFLGVICLIFGIASMWRFIAACRNSEFAHRGRHLIAHGVLLGMVSWLLWMANSMTSLACFVLASGLIAITSLRAVGRRQVIVHLLVVAMVLIPFVTLFIGHGGGIFESMGRDPTLTGRTEIWDQLLHLSKNPLFGAGFESFWLGTRLEHIWITFPEINEAHNGYLEVFLNLGWIGLILLGIVIVTGYRSVMLELRRDVEMGYLKLAYLVGAVVYSLTEAGFRMMNPVWFLFLLAVIHVTDHSASSVAVRMPEYLCSVQKRKQPWRRSEVL